MGPVPSGFTLEKVVGRELNQICIGRYDLQFCFDSSHVISCQGKVIIELDGKSVVVFERDEPWWSDVTVLPSIAGRDATAWKIESSHEFSISLTGDAKLRFQSTDCPYEEFVIHPEIWVV
jgi:hypothetical protein